MDTVNNPNHYRSDTGSECIDVIEAWGLGFSLGNALKYVCRAGHKVGTPISEDLRKGLWYARRALLDAFCYDGPHSLLGVAEPTPRFVCNDWGISYEGNLGKVIRAIYSQSGTPKGRAEIVNRMNLALMQLSVGSSA